MTDLFFMSLPKLCYTFVVCLFEVVCVCVLSLISMSMSFLLVFTLTNNGFKVFDILAFIVFSNETIKY